MLGGGGSILLKEKSKAETVSLERLSTELSGAGETEGECKQRSLSDVIKGTDRPIPAKPLGT